MKLYFNGCSFTKGDELTDPKTTAFPAVMSKKLGLEFVNDAESGGSNQRIVYRTVQNLNEYEYFIIAWTNYNIFTEYNPVDNFEINFTPNLNLETSLHLSNDLKENYKKYYDYGKLYYTHWHNELYEFKKWLQEIILLQSVFEKQNKKYIMLNAVENNLEKWTSPKDKFIFNVKPLLDFFDYLNDDQILAEYNNIQTLLSMIDYSYYLDFNQWCITDCNKEFQFGKGGHPLEDGHNAIADKLINFYNKNQ